MAAGILYASFFKRVNDAYERGLTVTRIKTGNDQIKSQQRISPCAKEKHLG
jgi:hypothetical protein